MNTDRCRLTGRADLRTFFARKGSPARASLTALAEQPAQVRRAVRGNALRLAGSRPDLLPPTCKFLAADAGETREPVHGLLLEKLRE